MATKAKTYRLTHKSGVKIDITSETPGAAEAVGRLVKSVLNEQNLTEKVTRERAVQAERYERLAREATDPDLRKAYRAKAAEFKGSR